MFEKLDKKVLDSLLDIYKDIESYRSYFPKIIAEKHLKCNDKLVMIKSFIDNYATLYYQGLIDASTMRIDQIDMFINGIIEEDFDTLDERCSNKDILTRLIKIYYDLDNTIEEYGEEICKEHLKGLIARRNSLEIYISIFARQTFKKFAKKEDIPVEEIFKSLHGVYPVQHQIKRRA